MQIAYIRNLTVFQSVNGCSDIERHVHLSAFCLSIRYCDVDFFFLGEVVMTFEDNSAFNVEDQV